MSFTLHQYFTAKIEGWRGGGGEGRGEASTDGRDTKRGERLWTCRIDGPGVGNGAVKIKPEPETQNERSVREKLLEGEGGSNNLISLLPRGYNKEIVREKKKKDRDCFVNAPARAQRTSAHSEQCCDQQRSVTCMSTLLTGNNNW